MTRETLDAIGRRYGAPQASSGRDYLDAYEEALARLEPAPTLIVLALGEGGTATANAFGRRFPETAVHLLLHHDDEVSEPAPAATAAPPPTNVVVRRCRTGADRAVVLDALPRADLLVEGFTRSGVAKVAAMRRLHGYVRAGGVYGVEQADLAVEGGPDEGLGSTVRAVIDAAVERSGGRLPARGWTSWIDALALSLGPVRYRHGLALLAKSRGLDRMLTAVDVHDVLRARYGDRSPVARVVVRPGLSFASRAVVTTHGSGPKPLAGSLTVPTLELRRYRDVVAYPRQLVRHGDFWLPETFRRQFFAKPAHSGLLKSGDAMAAIRSNWAPARVRRADGPVYFLDTEFPGHFGHVSTEVVARLWGWDRVRQEAPDVRALVSLRPGQQAMPSYVCAMLEAYGIPRDRLLVLAGDEHLEAPVLYAADQQFQNRRYVSPDLVQTWERIRAGLGPTDPPVRAGRIFVTRAGRRRPRQGEAIEAFFADRGFTIVRPETYSFAEQVALFAQADIIAGYGGSGMFTMAYAPRARIILISGDDYLAQNEALIAGANGNEIHYFWGRSLASAPEPGKPRRVYDDDFDFDLPRHRRALRALTR